MIPGLSDEINARLAKHIETLRFLGDDSTEAEVVTEALNPYLEAFEAALREEGLADS